MSELTDDQLDGLFRKSAEEFDPPFDPAAWQDMRTRLDAHDRPTPGGGTPLWKNLLRWGLPICLLLLTVGGLYLYRRNTPSREALPGNVITAPPTNSGTQIDVAGTAMTRLGTSKPQPGHTDSAPTTSTSSSAQSVDPAGQSTELTKPVSEQPAITASPTKSANQSDGLLNGSEETNTPATAGETNEKIGAYVRETNASKTERNRTARLSKNLTERTVARVSEVMGTKQRTGKSIPDRSSKRKQKQSDWLNSRRLLVATNDAISSSPMVKKRSLETGADKSSSPLTATSSPKNFIQPMIDQAEPAGLPDVRELTIRPAKWPKPLVFTKRPVDLPPTIEAPDEPALVVPKSPVERGLSVRLAVAPDLSSIGLKNFARPGTNVGVLLEYRLAPRWSVQAGVIQSTKIYRASASDYELSDYFKNGMYTIPQGVDGQCKMLDIPINVRYDFLLSPRADGRSPSRWFLTGGVTSYLIEQEDYAYKYTGYVHKPIPDYSDKGKSYGFSQLNLSVGYERALTKRLSWQIEPFMKMPLRKVGYLNLNLLSTGAFFSIRYKL
ncbi:porin family protein [Spirosoma horti]